MHRPDLHHVANLLTLQDTISTAPGHSRDVQKLGPIDHVVIYTRSARTYPVSGQRKRGTEHTLSSSDTDTLRLDLVAETALVFPQRRRDPRLCSRRAYLAGGVERVGLRGRCGIARICGIVRICMV